MKIMENQLKTSKSSQCSIESDKVALEKSNEQEPEKVLIPEIDWDCHCITTKVERQAEIRLAIALKNFPERWKYFCFGSILDMKIRWRNGEIPVEEFQDMINQMTKKVQALHICPTGNIDFEPKTITGLTDIALLSYATQVVEHLNSLRQFTISGIFGDLPLSFNALESFTKKIARNLVRLQKLTLNLSDANMNNTVIGMMSRELARGLINMQSIEIFMRGSQTVTNKGLGALFYGLNKYSSRLKHLEISCYDFIEDGEISVIGENLHRNLGNLRSFALKIQNVFANLTDKGLEILGFKIGKHLINLEHLNLSFYSINKISDKGTETLFSKICKSIRNLKSLSLAFSNCENVTDSTFKKVFTVFGETQKNLTKLSLVFRQNNKIGQSTFKFILNQSQISLNGLTHLKLNLFRCEEINNNALLMLKDWIKQRHPGLKSLFLNVAACYHLSKECMTAVYNDLNFIPDLEMMV